MRGQAGAGSQGGLYRHVGACLLLCVLVASTDACKGAVPACTVRSEAPRVDYNSFGNSLSSLRRASWRVRRAPLGDARRDASRRVSRVGDVVLEVARRLRWHAPKSLSGESRWQINHPVESAALLLLQRRQSTVGTARLPRHSDLCCLPTCSRTLSGGSR